MANPRLLIVDDEERFLTTTKTLLQKREITTFTSTNGPNASKLSCLPATHPQNPL